MKKLIILFLCLIVIIILYGCCFFDNSPVITSFTVLKENNKGLSSDVVGVIEDIELTNLKITVILPEKYDLSSIIANFEVEGSYDTITYIEDNELYNIVSSETSMDYSKSGYVQYCFDAELYSDGYYHSQNTWNVYIGFLVDSTIFPDSNFYKLILDKMGRNTFYTFELTEINSLDIDDDISDLTGINYLYFLTYLDISSPINSLTPLSESSLMSLIISDTTNITDFNPIADIEELNYLKIDDTNFSDTTFLSNTKHLETLYLSNCNINSLNFWRFRI